MAADEPDAEVSIGWRRDGASVEELPAGAIPVIPVPAKRMSLPGQLREVHFYDTSNLAVLRYAKQHTGGYYVQAVIDEHAMENRQFRLCKFGVLRKVVDTQGGIHRNNMGESSDSVRGRVLGMARVELGDIVQREPFVAARVAPAPLEWFGKNSHDQHRQIRDLFARCDHLCRAIGDDGLKSTIFEDLGDLPASGTGAPGFATDAGGGGASEDEVLRAEVQRRVADAMGAAGLGRARSLDKLEELGVGQDEAGQDTGGGDSGGAPLALVADRVLQEVVRDGRRTRPATPGGLGATVPFLLPAAAAGSDRLALETLAALRYLPPDRRLLVFSQENGEAAMQAVADGLEDAARILTEMEREWSR